MRVLIVSEHRISRECMVQWLKRTSSADYHFASCAIREIDSAESPTVVLVDRSDCAEETILQLVRDVRDKFPDCRPLVMGTDERELTRYIEAGAAGFVARDRSPRELIVAIESVLEHDANCSPEQAALIFARLQELARRQQVPSALNANELTIRELEILKLIDLGNSNKQIASALTLSVHTVKTHVHHILEKVGAANRRRAVYLSYRNGWLTKDQ